MSSKTPYQNLALVMREIARLAEAGEWGKAAQTAVQLNAQIQSGYLPPAQEADRAAIEESVARLAAVAERAEPLRQDIAVLLKAFGGGGGKTEPAA
ncbi:MAG: hypothetical protein LBD68_08985 [Zoogloeaceae bacterium]|jgi:sugar phosphate isomerase/epimerase|nr:hypothetical protein [Zoogloeaceae bacterium]